MGSFCTSSPSKTESTQSYTPAGLDQLKEIWGKVSSAASTPYQPYGGQMVAGLNPIQNAGISNINAAAGSAQPYYDLAAQYGKTGAAQISPNDIQRYMSPYTQQVVDSTRANFGETNAQQQQQVIGNAALKGALGGDRVGVAQSELARQQKMAQDPVIANLYNQGYTQAVGAAQADRAAAGQGAFTFGSLAPAIQNSQIQGGQAQIGAGSVAQGNEQQKLAAQYAQYQQALAFPYQQASFLSSAGLPAISAMGGTQQGQSTTTPSQASPFQQILGGGLAIAGLAGGIPGLGSFGSGFAGTSPTGADMGSSGYANWGSNPFTSSGAMNPAYMTRASGGRTNGPRSRANRRPRFADGGFIDQVHSIRQALRGGGPVIDMRRGHDGSYADGGEVSFADRFGAANDAIESGEFDPVGRNYMSPYPLANAAPNIPIASVPMPQPRPQMDVAPTAIANTSPYGLPPQITNPGGAGPITLPPDAMAYDAPQPTGGLRAPMGAPQQQPSGPFGLSEDARMGLVAAGLGILGSKSSSALGAVGEGGLEGLKHYAGSKQNRDRNDLAARKLIMDAEQFAKTHDVREKTLLETKRYHDLASDDRRDLSRERSEDRRSALEERERANRENAEIRREAVRAKVEEANKKRDDGKALPTAAITKLSDAGSAYSDFNRLTSTWKPEYGGKVAGFIGEGQNLLGRNVGAGYGDQAQWWQDYQVQKNQIRHSLFGSALTATEKGEFDKAAINPGMTDKAIQENLGRQKMAAERAARKLATAYRKSGYNADAVEAAVGVPLQDIGAGESRGVAPPVPTGAPAVTPPAGAVDKLKADRSLAPAFDAKYGPGASKRFLGEQ